MEIRAKELEINQVKENKTKGTALRNAWREERSTNEEKVMEEEANQQGRAANPESEDCSRLYLTSTFVKRKKTPKLWRDGEREMLQEMCHRIKGKEDQCECCRAEENK